MADDKKVLLRRAAERIRAEVAVKQATPPSEKELVGEVVKALKLRGVSLDVIDKISEVRAELAIWSKTYTENSKSTLIGPDGEVLYEVNTPLTQVEIDLINELGLRHKEK